MLKRFEANAPIPLVIGYRGSIGRYSVSRWMWIVRKGFRAKPFCFAGPNQSFSPFPKKDLRHAFFYAHSAGCVRWGDVRVIASAALPLRRDGCHEAQGKSRNTTFGCSK